jgi:hypothetical protein
LAGRFAPALLIALFIPTLRPSTSDFAKSDRAVVSFLKSEALHPADFTIREHGVVRLNPQLAQFVASHISLGFDKVRVV